MTDEARTALLQCLETGLRTGYDYGFERGVFWGCVLTAVCGVAWPYAFAAGQATVRWWKARRG